MKKGVVLLAVLATLFAVCGPGAALADSSFGITITNPLCPNQQPGTPCISDLQQFIKKVTDLLTPILGSIAALMIIIAGILFVISRGDSGKTGMARKMALWAVIGFGVVLSASALTAIIGYVIG
jgi:hypothetical protein